MPDSFTYVVRIYDIEFCGEITQPLTIATGFSFTDRFQHVQGELERSFFEVIGRLETKDLATGGALAYTCGDATQLRQSGITPDEFILKGAHHLSVFLYCLWLIKDHSAYPGLGFIQIREGENILVFSNNLRINLTTATGESKTTSFSEAELTHATNLMKRVIPLFGFDFRLAHSPKTAMLGSQREAKRVGRSIYFSSLARSVNDLGVKVVNYCTSLECLFSTDGAELSHKVAQRASNFLGGSIEDRLARYELIKRAYGVRSKVVHGDTLSKDSSQRIAEIARNLDDLIRILLTKIVSSEECANKFEESRESLERWFLLESFSQSIGLAD